MISNLRTNSFKFFFTESGRHLVTLREAHKRKQLTSLFIAARDLRNSARNIGLDVLYTLLNGVYLVKFLLNNSKTSKKLEIELFDNIPFFLDAIEEEIKWANAVWLDFFSLQPLSWQNSIPIKKNRATFNEERSNKISHLVTKLREFRA